MSVSMEALSVFGKTSDETGKSPSCTSANHVIKYGITPMTLAMRSTFYTFLLTKKYKGEENNEYQNQIS